MPPFRRTTPLSLLLPLLALATLLAAACTTSDDTLATPTPSPSPTSEATPTSTTSPTPVPDVRNATVLLPGLRVRTAPSGPDLGRLPEGERVIVVGRHTTSEDPQSVWLGVQYLGWVRYSPGNIELDREVEALPLIEHPDLRLSTRLPSNEPRTGIAAIDSVIEAVLTHQIDTLASLVHLHQQPCTGASGPAASPTCPEGVPTGTPVATFDVGTCGDQRELADQLPQFLADFLDPNQGRSDELSPLMLHTVFGPDRDAGGYWTFFAPSPNNPTPVGFLVTKDGAIASIGHGCDEPATTPLPTHLPILNHYLQSPLTPPPTSTARILPPGLRVRTTPGGLDLGRLPAQERVTVVGRISPSLSTPDTWLGLEGIGWVRYHRNSIELRGNLEDVPEIDIYDPRPAAPLHPADARTGIPAVDAVITVVLTTDTATLASLVQIRDANFDISACGGDRGPADELVAYIDALFDPAHQGYGPQPVTDLTSLHLYAVYQNEPFPGDYVLHFAYSPGSIGRSLGVSEGGAITRIGYGCGGPVTTGGPANPPAQLSPYAPPPLTPPIGITAPPPTGVPAVDAVFAAVQQGDDATLIAMVETTEGKCASDADPGYNTPCSNLGLDPGETYEGIPAGACDVSLIPAARIPELVDELIDPAEHFTTPYGAYLARDEIYLGRTAVVLFANPQQDAPLASIGVVLVDSRIVRVTGSCGDPLPLPTEVGYWLHHPSDLGYDVPPPDVDPAATRPFEGSPLDGADLILALHAQGIRSTPYHEGIGLCDKTRECATGILYTYGTLDHAGDFFLWVYETTEDRTAEWSLAPDGRATHLVGSTHPGVFYGNANLVLLMREPLDETAQAVIDVLLELTP